jgi:S-adenosylmethionine hydrolase
LRSITLLTDFGTRDPYVASMKGVIASRCDAVIHDLSHEIAPFDVFAAGWFLATCGRWWPSATIFVAVVDPGVGTSRRIIAAEKDARISLAPDNGLLTFLEPFERIVSVENESYFLPDGSTTFHGRDRFAPVAAAIANGTPLDDLGPRVESIVRLDYSPPAYGDEEIRGTIAAVDRFGNCITDVEAARINFGRFALIVKQLAIDRVLRTYGDADDRPFLLVGSSGHIEISLANDSAAARLQLRRGDRVMVVRA